MQPTHIRNIAIIAHVDHGKTTLVDRLLMQSGTIASHRELQDRAMDSNDIERERGITIMSKCTTVEYLARNGQNYGINIVDTPGHADFGGEVERVLKMVDSVLLLVDAFEGPMPQTRFVLRKSLELGLKPIVVINKIDRTDSRPDEVVDLVFDLFVALNAEEDQLDFPIIYASAKMGYAMLELEDDRIDMEPLLEEVVRSVAPPNSDVDKPFCMQVATLAYDPFVGRLAIGRIFDGTISVNSRVSVCSAEGDCRKGKITKLMRFKGLERIDTDRVSAGDIIMLAGLDGILPGDTINLEGRQRYLGGMKIDEPTISMRFMTNTSPFVGKEGKFVTSRQLRERLLRELDADVSLRIKELSNTDSFEVSGRGELHLSILIERMRREGYELGVSRPRVIFKKDEKNNLLEPMETVTVECGNEYSGTVISKLNLRKGTMQAMSPSGSDMTRLEYMIPSRGLIGFRSEFLTDTRGTGVLYANFSHYGAYKGEISKRKNGAIIAQSAGTTTTYALFTLQARGVLFVEPGQKVYGGQIIGQHAKTTDLVVNPTRKKNLTNVRAAGSDQKLLLSPPILPTLESAIEWISDDELVEVTTSSVRIRKLYRDHNERKRMSRKKK